MAELLDWLADALVLFLIVRFVMRLFSASRRQAQWPKASAPKPERSGGTLVRDPQCGTYIPETRAIRTGSGPDAVYFCSATCRDAYAAAHRAPRPEA